MQNRRQFFETIAGIAFTAPMFGRVLPDKNITHLSPSDMHEKGSLVGDGLKNLNGHIYPRTAWEQMQNSKHYVSLGIGEKGIGLDLELLAATLSDGLHIEETHESFRVYADIKPLDTPSGVAVRRIIDKGVRMFLTPVGTGLVNNEGYITDYKFLYWALSGNSAFIHAQPMLLKIPLQK